MSRLTAQYLVETPNPLERAAATLAGEQSSGTFVAVPGETDEFKHRFAARVEKIEPLETASAPAIPTGRAQPANTTYRRARVSVSWTLENFSHNLPTIVSTIQGNLYELSQFSGLKLLDIEIPEELAARFRGPRFGIEGTRTLTGAPAGHPLIGTIIKPSIGLSPAQTAAMVAELIEGGVDFLKDDELMADPPHSPFNDRVDAIMRVINAHADRTGRKPMYAFNISDELDAMQRHYEKVVSAGGNGVMLSLNSVGLVAAKKICDIGALAIHGHRNGWGMLNRHPLLGIEFPAYQKLWRLAGVDQLHSTASRTNSGNPTTPWCVPSPRVSRRCTHSRVFSRSSPPASGVDKPPKHGAARKSPISSTWPAAESKRIPMAPQPACARCISGGKPPWKVFPCKTPPPNIPHSPNPSPNSAKKNNPHQIPLFS